MQETNQPSPLFITLTDSESSQINGGGIYAVGRREIRRPRPGCGVRAPRPIPSSLLKRLKQRSRYSGLGSRFPLFFK